MLHTINKSPFGSNSFETSTRFFQQVTPSFLLKTAFMRCKPTINFPEL